ncbi:hypothetical protein GCM10011328_01800 [Hafnia psychrotolerans]|uniref:Uncharacterized protein n=1 Tax=Hafnia psychrotolerans TaxID=1477018 RepID=A0ABQ1FU55_9GAMM|nr:hypothetical protein GCM10011328_01800 [Hafnia psychrotolerans]
MDDLRLGVHSGCERSFSSIDYEVLKVNTKKTAQTQKVYAVEVRAVEIGSGDKIVV